MTYGDRAILCTNTVAKVAFQLIEEKQTNLCLSVDLTKAADILRLVDEVGSEICILKTHVDIIEDFSQEFINELTMLSHKHHFLLFEDRKFADIGNTVANQYAKGMYNIVEWADITNAHTVSGPGTIDGLRSVVGDRNRGLLLLAQMSPEGVLIDDKYRKNERNGTSK